MSAEGRPWSAPPAVMALGVFLAVGAAFAATVLPADALVTIDGYYHLKIADWMTREGPVVDIRWLPFTILGESGTDHHWLWHLLLTPFAWFDDLFTGLKWGTVVTGAAVPALLALVGARLRVPWPPVVALLTVAGSVLMPGRLLMLRTQNLAIVLIALALLAMVERRHLLLAALACAFMMAYHGAVILGPLVLLHAAVVWAREGRPPWRPVVAVLGGALVGLVASPWFPGNVEYLLFHTLFKVTNPGGLQVGSEWARPGLGHVLREAFLVHLALAGGLLALLVRRRRPAADTWTWLAATALMLVLYTSAWRFLEYYVPVGALAAGLLLRDALSPLREVRPWLRRTAPVLLALPMLLVGARGLAIVEDHAQFVPTKYARLAEVLRAEAEPDDVVFNTAWEDFVFLLWHDTGTRFVNGLDPNYLAYADRPRFGVWSWVQQYGPGETDDPAPVIRDVFGARWVVVDRQRRPLARRLQRSPSATLEAHSDWGWLFRLAPPGDP